MDDIARGGMVGDTPTPKITIAGKMTILSAKLWL